MFGALALHSAGCAALWRWSGAGSERRRRVLQTVAVGAAVVVASALAFPGLLVGASDAWRWMARDEAFQGMVLESSPLFLGSGGIDLSIPEVRLSRFIYLFPAALVALWLEARRGEQRAELLLLVFWCLVLAGVTVAQRRFFNTFSVGFALVMGWSAVQVYRVLPPLLPAFRARKAATGALVLAFFTFLMAPVFRAYQESFHNHLAAIRGEPLALGGRQGVRRALVAGAEWLRINTPPTSGFLDPEISPEYGVLSRWTSGHILKYEARRPTVVGNFGDDLGGENFRLSLTYFRSGEDRAVQILEKLKVRYVVMRLARGPVLAEADRRAMVRRLSGLDVLTLNQHRLVYETPLGRRGDGAPQAEYRIFEFVRGARLAGQASPGKRVGARISCLSNRGRKILARLTSRADPNGRYALTLPYATHGAPPAVLCDSAYTVFSGGRRVEVAVHEDQVQSGSPVLGPDLRRQPSFEGSSPSDTASTLEDSE
jgi:asparagine N-glycosylation enzyme membrane subunit Stt3